VRKRIQSPFLRFNQGKDRRKERSTIVTLSASTASTVVSRKARVGAKKQDHHVLIAGYNLKRRGKTLIRKVSRAKQELKYNRKRRHTSILQKKKG